MQKALQQMHISRFSSAEARLKTLESFSTTDSDRWVQTVKSAETDSGAAGQMNTRLRTYIARKHTLKSNKTWEACRIYLPRKRFVGVSSVALYPVTQVFWSWARVAATQSLTRLEVLRSARWPKLSQCLKAAERMRQVQTRPRTGRSQVSVQSTLTSKEKYSDSNQTPKSLLPT